MKTPARLVCRHRRRRGYTVTELMMALGVFFIGAAGVAAMQTVTINSNRVAREIATATQIASSWQDQLALDANNWTTSAGTTNTLWLQNMGGGWAIPANEAGGGADTTAFRATGRYDALGHPTTSNDDRVFCVNVRTTLLRGTATGSEPSVARTEVRVYWPRKGSNWAGAADYCSAGAIGANVGTATEAFNFIYKTSAVRKLDA